MPKTIFLSHKNTQESNDVVKVIAEGLEKHGYKCWNDDDDIHAGMNWKSEITNNLLHSDVVIVVLDESTSESDWVQREIDIARSREISLLPVIIGNHEKVASALDRFNMKEDQFIKWRWPNQNEIIDAILQEIAPLTEKTINHQKQMYANWKEYRKFVPNVQYRPEHKVYHLAGKEELCDFVIVAGDATEIPDYDILVNTENDYMQMARFFEMNTLSAIIRWRGADFDDVDAFIQDTIQNQLNNQLNNMGATIPVGSCAVIPTFAGNEGSKLRKKGFTYIFHAAAVQINPINRQISSLDAATANPKIVGNCFEQAKKIHDNDGAILYDKRQIMQSAADKKDISSILFPVFGAGQGGNTLEEAIEGIVKGFKSYFEKQTDHIIKRVGLCIYNFDDVPIVESIFEKNGFKPAE